MKAFVYDENGKLSLRQRERPGLMGEVSAVVEVLETAICGTDLRTYRHGSRHIEPPRTIGHEVVGRIVELDNDVDGFAVGDRVHVAPAIGCGSCHYCMQGHTNLCDNLRTIGFQYDGSFSEFMQLPASAFRQGNVAKINSDTPDRELVLAEPLACVMNAQEFLPVEKADSMAIFGGGFIGCLHAELGRAKGVTDVLIVEPNGYRASAAQQAVPHATIINPKEHDLGKAVRERTGGLGVNVSVVACSVGSAQADAMQITRKLGHVSLFGGLPGESTGFIDSNIIHYNEISVHGVHASTPAHNKKAIEWLESGKLVTKPYTQNEFGLSEIRRAFEAVDTQEVLKALIRPGE